MKRYAEFTVLAGLVVGLAVMPAFAVRGPRSSRLGGQKQNSSQSATAKKKKVKLNPKEEKAYKKFYKTPESNPKAITQNGKEFLKKFPKSRYAPSVYARMADAYEVLGDTDDMFDAAHKALQLNPNNVDVLSLMAYTIPRRIDPSNLGAGAKLKEASDDAHKALALLPTVPKPPNMTQAQFTKAINGEASSCHSGLGLVAYYNHNIPGMVSELEQAVKLNPTPDPSDQYLLGLAYMQAGRPADAEDILQKCSSSPGPLAARCTASLAQAKKLAAAKTKQ